MNNMQIKDKIRNICREKNVDFNTVFKLYMYDRFIERLAVSKYKDNFILKGGFYLSTLFGIENRSTRDIDTAFRNDAFTESNIKKIVSEILEIDVGDNAELKLLNISSIRENDEYGGFRIDINVVLGNIKEKFHIDIATGDPITPKAITYKYYPVLSDNAISVWAYNIETVLAEKLETILTRGEFNGRIRDYYDIYLIYTKDWDNINKNHFRSAVEKTLKKREYIGNIIETFNLIRNSDILEKSWKLYAKKYNYSTNVSYQEVMDCLKVIIDTLELVTIP